MVLCVSCVCARASLDDGDGVRERCSHWLPESILLLRLGDAAFMACGRRDGGGGVATRDLPPECDHGGFFGLGSWLSMAAC